MSSPYSKNESVADDGMKPEVLIRLPIFKSKPIHPPYRRKIPKSLMLSGYRKGLSSKNKFKFKMEETPEYQSTIKSIKATLQKGPWFKIEGKKVEFPNKIPIIFYPALLEDMGQPDCKLCLKSKEFFVSVGDMYRTEMEACKRLSDDISQEMILICEKLIITAEKHRHHEFCEFVDYVVESDSKVFKDDHLYKIECERWKRLDNYVNFMMNKLDKMKVKLTDKLGDPRAFLNDRSYKALKFHIDEGVYLRDDTEKLITEMVLVMLKSRMKMNPSEFFNDVDCVEDVLVSRVGNAAVMTEWLKDRQDRFLKISGQSLSKKSNTTGRSPTDDGFKSLGSQLVNELDFPLKLCNTMTRPWNAIQPELPHSLSHFFAFTHGNKINDIHPSWYRTLMNPTKTSPEIVELSRRNWHLDSYTRKLEQEIQRMDIEQKVYSYIKKRCKEPGQQES